MTPPRGLSAEEAAAWARLAASVDPMEGRIVPPPAPARDRVARTPSVPKSPIRPAPIMPVHSPSAPPTTTPPPRTARRVGGSTLDRTWDRKLKAGSIPPDFTLDLHDHFVDAAYERLDRGMRQALAMNARLMVIVTGRPRPVEAADRGVKRGVIRAKILDWLAAGDHADAIAAIRKAHRRHGGEGALYIVLRRNR
ncbi:MAG: Smr/MutS family protein [Pontixanthobacter sp.]